MQWIDDYVAERRYRRDERAADLYGTLYEAEDDRRRREWAEEFDTIPYVANGADIHKIVARRMAEMREAA